MKFSVDWLKQHLDTSASLDDIVDTMVRVGLEVESARDPAKDLEGFVVGEILEAHTHPDADKLQVCKVNTGSDVLEVVCGAPNARAGLRGVFAPVGAYVPGIELTLTKAKIRGVESNGMMCSEKELELSEQHEGIIELPSDTEVGSDAAAVLGIDDPVIDFEVTPNRPDTLAVAGVARDLAAAGLGALITPEIRPAEGSFPCPVSIGLKFDKDSSSACPVFAGRLVRGVKNGPSPDWLQRRLLAIGLRPINALVDITNFVSYDRARPLHVYDADKLNGQIHARLAKKGEELLALDGKEYSLSEEMCVIADDTGVLGLGGVMGGETTGCTEETVNVFIESAYFDPLRTARTGRTTGIVSDARYRFERGVDPAFVIPGLELATNLIVEICGGEPSELEVAGSVPQTDVTIDFDPGQVKRLTGLTLDETRIESILSDLGFGLKKAAGSYAVHVPSWRPDVEGSACLVEEVARIYGFEELPSEPMPRLAAVAKPQLTPIQIRERVSKRELASRGLMEAVTWSFVSEDQAQAFDGGSNAQLRLVNPISSDLNTMRPSILPGLLAAVSRNKDRGIHSGGLFEVGPQYRHDGPDGQSRVATGVRFGAAEGPASERHWSGRAHVADALDAKADAFAVLSACGVNVSGAQTVTGAPDWYHPGRSGVVQLGPKNRLACFGEIHPGILDRMDVAGPIVAFEVYLDAIPPGKSKGTKTRPAADLPELLPLERDFAFIVEQDVSADSVLAAVRKAEKKLIVGASIFDVFEDPSLGENNKSLAVSVTLQPTEKTLKDTEIEAIASKIVGAVEKATGGKLRG